jgi:hypothetical protein
MTGFNICHRRGIPDAAETNDANDCASADSVSTQVLPSP